MPSIAIIYEYGNEGWSTPWSIYQEFVRLGWTVSRYHLSQMTGLDMCNLINNSPDMCIVMDWKGIDILPTLKRSLYSSGCYMVRECADTPQNFDNHLPVCDGYDLLLTPDYTSAERYKTAGYNCLWWTHFADTGIDPPYRVYDGLPKVRSTRGPGSSYILDSLSKIMPDKFINKNGMIGEDYTMFLSEGLITVQHSRFGEYTRRLSEGAFCRTALLTDRLAQSTHIQDIFTEDESIMFYDSLAECISKINWLLSPEGTEKRVSMSQKAYDIVVSGHTQVQRVNSILLEYATWLQR